MSVQDFPHKGQVSRLHYSRGIYDSSKNSVVFEVRSAGVKRDQFPDPSGAKPAAHLGGALTVLV